MDHAVILFMIQTKLEQQYIQQIQILDDIPRSDRITHQHKKQLNGNFERNNFDFAISPFSFFFDI